MNITLNLYYGEQIIPWLDAVARLRIEVFREFPYLYDGNPEYEKQYLAHYAASTNSLFVLAIHEENVIGASTAIALTEAEPTFQTPFLERNIPLNTVLYFGESVLQKNWRGHGLGHQFFDRREDFARQLQKNITAFCAVERSPLHPLRPPAYSPLNTFWQQRGYQQQTDMKAQYAWQDIDEQSASDKNMVFWLRDENNR